MSTRLEPVKEINELKKKRDAVILAHNYQIPEIQDIADYTGDSLELSKIARDVKNNTIVFCGVHFMAETAAILCPEKTVLLPVLEAGCPMADMVTAEALRKKKQELSGIPVVTYVNSSAEVKAESDYCCTSANADKVLNAIDSQEILFVPDQNLGHYASKITGKKVHLWDGYCITHHRISSEDVTKAKEKHPHAVVLVHPECKPEVVDMADYVASTSGILELAKELDSEEFIIGTEMGLLHRLEKENPQKKFYILSLGMICPNMKMTGIDDITKSLSNNEYIIKVDEDIRKRAEKAIDRMVEIT